MLLTLPKEHEILISGLQDFAPHWTDNFSVGEEHEGKKKGLGEKGRGLCNASWSLKHFH